MTVPEDSKTKDAARLKAIIARAETTRLNDDIEGRNTALTELVDFRIETDHQDLRDIAKDAHFDLNNQDKNKALAALVAVAKRLEPFIPVLDEAAGIAAAGAESLLFPKAAKKTAELLDKVVKLKQDIETLKQTVKEEAKSVGEAVDSIHELKDIPDALDKLTAALEKLRQLAARKK